MTRKARLIAFALLAAVSFVFASCKKDNTLMYGNLTMGNFVGDKFISDQGNEFTIVENNTGKTFEGIERGIMQCDVLNKTEGVENGYDVRVVYLSEVLTKAPVTLEEAAADPEKVVDDPITIDYAWISGGYLNLYLVFEIQHSPKLEERKHMVNLLYSPAEVGKGNYTLTLRHNAYGETLAGKETEEGGKLEEQTQLQSTDMIQWGLTGGYVSFQLSDIITESEAELSINWVEHVTDTQNNWLTEVVSKSGTLTYSKTNFEQVPLKLTTKTTPLK